MTSIKPDEALVRLSAGNRRFMENKLTHPNEAPAYRRSLTAGQHPFAAILGCADSRVPPEIIFDQGLGDLFVVRVAGNIADNASLGSLEYSVQQLGVPLIVVLGHSNCGAVKAALGGGSASGQIATLISALQPAVLAARAFPGETQELVIARAVRANVALIVHQLRAAYPILAPQANAGTLKIVGATYDLGSGQVELLP